MSPPASLHTRGAGPWGSYSQRLGSPILWSICCSTHCVVARWSLTPLLLREKWAHHAFHTHLFSFKELLYYRWQWGAYQEYCFNGILMKQKSGEIYSLRSFAYFQVLLSTVFLLGHEPKEKLIAYSHGWFAISQISLFWLFVLLTRTSLFGFLSFFFFTSNI